MYTDPITKNTYPSKDWMMANMETLPEVKAAYGSQPATEPTAPTTLTTQSVASQPSTSGLTAEQSSGLQAIYNELQARQLAGTPANQPRVSSITNTPTIPEQALDTTPPALSTTTADTINSMIQKEQADLAARQASAQKTLSDAGVLGTGNTLQEQLLTGYQSNVPVSQYEQKLTEAQNQYGVIEALDEYKLQGEKVAQAKAVIENLDIQRQTELDAALNRQASMSSITAEQNRINQKYDSQRAKLVGDYNIEAAILATQSNNLTEANKLVSQAVDAYTSDITAEINRFNNLYSIASDFVSSLSKDEKSVLDDIKTQLYAKEKSEKERLTNVLNLKLEYSNAGIEPTDTIEEAMAKAENWSKENPTISQTLGSAETGYTMYDKYGNVIGTKEGSSKEKDATIFNSLMQEVINAGGDIYGAVAAANELAQSQYGTSLSISEMNNLLSIASSMTPIETQETQGQTEPTNAIDISKVTGEKTFGIGTAPKKTMGIGSYGTSLQANNINIPKQETRSVGIGAPDTTSWFNQLFSE